MNPILFAYLWTFPSRIPDWCEKHKLFYKLEYVPGYTWEWLCTIEDIQHCGHNRLEALRGCLLGAWWDWSSRPLEEE